MRLLVLILVCSACGPKAGEGEEPEEDTLPEASSGDASDLPASCDDGEPYDDECQTAFAEQCSTRTDAQSCTETEPLPGGLSLQCAWIEPSLVVISGEECTLEPAAPRCVGVAYPGDIGCGPLWLQEGEELLVVEPPICFPIGWSDCEADIPACDCLP